MTGLYTRPQSTSAILCLKIAIVTIPFLAISIVLHRGDAITSQQLFWLFAVGILMLLCSLFFGIKTAIDLWQLGYKGGKAMVNGVALSTIMLIPFGLQLLNAMEYPRLHDVATDVISTPVFFADRNDQVIDTRQVYEPHSAREIVENYPQLVGRRYKASPERVTKSVLTILNRWDWPKLADINLPDQLLVVPEKSPNEKPDDKPEGDQDQDSDDDKSSDEENLELSKLDKEGLDGFSEIVIEAQASSFFMRLKSRIVIRLKEEASETVVDMRSKSSWGPHDFGLNSKNITDFLTALDLELAGLAGE